MNYIIKDNHSVIIFLINFVLSILILMSCSDNTIKSISLDEIETQETSWYDEQPIVSLSDADFISGAYVSIVRDKVANLYGRELATAFLNQKNKNTGKEVDQFISSMSIRDIINKGSRQKVQDEFDLGTHLRITYGDDYQEEFILDISSAVPITHKNAKNSTSDVKGYLALNPDVFYAQEDNEGNDIWPITFPAVSLDGSGEEIMFTAHGEGRVSVSSSGSKYKGITNSLSDTGVELYYVQPTIVAIDDGSGGGGGGGGTSGPDLGPSPRFIFEGGSQYAYLSSDVTGYLAIKRIRLHVTGDGDGASELQMLVQRTDDFGNVYYRRNKAYEFDKEYKEIAFGVNNPNDFNYETKGADGFYTYITPDVDFAYDPSGFFFFNSGYSFENLVIIEDRGGNRRHYTNLAENGIPFLAIAFPAVALTDDYYRMVLFEDDKRYSEFSLRRMNTITKSVWTYNMGTDSYQLLNTKFDANRHENGSSDDVLLRTGVRKISSDTYGRFSGDITARKDNFFYELTWMSKQF